MRILVVEDNARLAKTLRDLLVHNHYLVDICPDGAEAFDHARSGIHDLIVLDVMLPGMDGFTIARKLRECGVTTPILMLTARSEVSDRIEGLRAGADYYLTKPFSNDELLACMRALLRRDWHADDTLTFGDVSLGLSGGQLFRADHTTRLSAREQQLIEMLMRAGSAGVSRERFLRTVWEPDAPPEGNVVDVYIAFLRRKLKYLRSGVRIVTVRGVGYRLEYEEDAP